MNVTHTQRKEALMRQPYRQGDILLVPVDEVPAGLTEIPREREQSDRVVDWGDACLWRLRWC